LQATAQALITPTCAVLYTSQTSKDVAAQVLAAARGLLPRKAKLGDVCTMMVVGFPNTGKTTLLNAIKQHAVRKQLLVVQRAGRLHTGPLPGVTKQVAGFKVSESPMTVMMDTPGVITARIASSRFALRAALAGLIDEKHVALEDLFAFALYVLAQEPNVTELKVTVAHKVPPAAGAHKRQQHARGGAGVRRPAVALRDAYGARRVAKCVLQAQSDVAHLRAGDTHRAHGSAWPGQEEAHGGRSRQVQSEIAGGRAHAGRPVAQREMGDARASDDGAPPAVPNVARDLLAQMGRGESATERTATHQVVGSLASAASRSGRSPDAAALSDEAASSASVIAAAPVRPSEASAAQQSTARVLNVLPAWEAFEPDVWHACGHALLQRLLRAGALEDPAVVRSAMERVVRLTREGALGRLLFEGRPGLAQQEQRTRRTLPLGGRMA
jgi:50S ribosome-binding GTPase